MTDSFFTNMQQLGRYEIRGRIGAGGMARVFKAYDGNLERLVAIKILHEHLADDANFKERFEREAKFIANFNHPNIVQVYDFATAEMGEQSIFYMVMPYIPGKTLKDILEDYRDSNQQMPPERVLQIMLNVADALGYAHERGMVHRDVKPANILFDERKQAVLTDFGIARMVQGSKFTQDGVTTGTPAYMSPEQVASLPVDGRSDLYALGVILYEMLAGRLPFADDNPISIMLKHLNTPVPHLSDAVEADNAALEAIIFKALAKEPHDRYQSAREFADALKAVFAKEEVALPQPISPLPQNNAVTTRIMADTAPLQEKIARPSTPVSRSPLGMLAIGMTLIAFLAVIALLSRQASLTSATKTDSSVPGMTGNMVVYFTSTFDAESEYNPFWPQGENSGLTSEITEDGFYRLRNQREGTAATTIFDPAYTYEDVAITLEGMLENDSQRASAYGIVFHYTNPDNYNVFAVDGVGRFSIWTRETGSWRELRGAVDTWSTDEAVNALGGTNRLTLEIHGSQYIAYVNDALVTEVFDETFASGHIGIYVATPPGGTASVLIDTYQAEESSSIVPSMTGSEEETTPESES